MPFARQRCGTNCKEPYFCWKRAWATVLASKQIGLYLLVAIKPATNSKQLALVYCPSIACILEQMAFQRQESQEDLESLKQAFPFSVLNTALHSCLKKKLVSIAEKKCLIERHTPSALKMGSAQSIWNWIKTRKLPKTFKGGTDFLVSLFFTGLSWVFSFSFILFACLSLISSFHHVDVC